VDIGSACVDRG